MFIMSMLACQHVTQHNNISFSRGKSIRLPGSGLERGPGCHPERSEGSLRPSSQTLRGVSPERSEGAQSLPLSAAKG